MNPPSQEARRGVILRKFRAALGFFIFALIVSGITSFPLSANSEPWQAFEDLSGRLLPMPGTVSTVGF